MKDIDKTGGVRREYLTGLRTEYGIFYDQTKAGISINRDKLWALEDKLNSIIRYLNIKIEDYPAITDLNEGG